MRLVTRGIAACALSLPVMVGSAAMASAHPGTNNYTTNNATTNYTTNNTTNNYSTPVTTSTTPYRPATMNHYGIRVLTPSTYRPANYGSQGAAAGPLGSAEFSNGDAACGGAMFHASGVFATQWGAGIVNDDSAAGSWDWRCGVRYHHEHEGHFHHGDGSFWN